MMRFAILATSLLAGGALAQGAAEPSMAPQLPQGYLAPEAAMASAAMLPPPPARNSPAEIADRYLYALSARGIGGPDWVAATEQISIQAPAFQKALTCAIGKLPGPATRKLLARTAADFVPPMAAAKAKFNRPRPFTTDKGQACDPDTADGVGAALGMAYPSGHSGIGWLWALTLADALPARANEIRAFGKGTGDLRVACRVHWMSDVQNGRVLAVSIHEKQRATPAFQADLAAARAELEAADDLRCE